MVEIELAVILFDAEKVFQIVAGSGIIVRWALRSFGRTEKERKYHFLRINGTIDENSVLRNIDASKY